jgi:hypothetical protein
MTTTKPAFALDRLPADDDELYHLVTALWGVVIPRHTVCPEHVAPFEVFADAYFNRGDDSITLWHGSRGLSGKSFMLSILGLTKAFLLGTDVNLLGGSLAQSTNIHEHMRSAMESSSAPKYMIETEAQYLIKLSNGARIRPLTASQKTVRGPHPPFLLLDEIDEMDINILDAALGQPMPQKNYLGDIIKPYTVLCSTWQNPEGTFTEVRRRFEERGLPIKTWCYRESANPIDGWLTEETIESKKREISKEMWRVEYELGEPSIGNRAFDSDAIEKTFAGEFAPVYEKNIKDYEEYVLEEPKHNNRYVAAADWAKEQDYTVITVMNVTERPFTLAYFLKLNRRPYPYMVGRFNEAIMKYSASALHDRTGLGNVVNDYLDIRANGFTMTGEKRDAMLAEYVSAIEKGEMEFPKITSVYLSHKYCRVGDLYDRSKDYHLPDDVCSLALAYRASNKYGAPVTPIGVRKSMEPNRYEKMFTMREQTRTVEAAVAGEVRQLTGETGDYNLTL